MPRGRLNDKHCLGSTMVAAAQPVKRLFPATIALTPLRCHSAQLCPSGWADRSGCIRTFCQNILRTGQMARAGSLGTRQDQCERRIAR